MAIPEDLPNDALIRAAAERLKPHTTAEGRLFGDVAAAVVSGDGNVYYGICLDTAGWGLCAERSAIAAMTTAGEYRISKVVAVWEDPDNAALYVMPPCGICRDFMMRIDRDNLEADVVLRIDARRARRDRVIGIEHGLEHFVLDLDQLRCRARDALVVGRDRS